MGEDSNGRRERLRALPAVSAFLQAETGKSLCARFGDGVTRFALRRELEEARRGLLAGELDAAPDSAALGRAVELSALRLLTSAGRRAINATGILLHTGLGRAPLSEAATAALGLAGGYSVLQTDPDSGRRSLREERVEELLRELTGCEAATVVNNNAAATMLVLNTLACGREVVISRGQLIEIGGSYRMTEVMAMSGCRLREVGCTNRTHLRDYEAALCAETGALIHVHTSNYRVRGFAGAPGIRELAALGKAKGLPVIDDLGSGALKPLSRWGLEDEPLAADSLAAGAEATCFSGDKLICGPQSGIICGTREAISRIRKNPFARMFRVCKLTLAALETTLTHFLDETWLTAIPFYRLLSREPAELEAQARAVAAGLAGAAAETEVREDCCYVGSGSLPDEGVPSRALAVKPRGLGPEELARRLRMGLPAVFGRVQDGALLLDMRTVAAEEAEDLTRRLRDCLGASNA